MLLCCGAMILDANVYYYDYFVCVRFCLFCFLVAFFKKFFVRFCSFLVLFIV